MDNQTTNGKKIHITKSVCKYIIKWELHVYDKLIMISKRMFRTNFVPMRQTCMVSLWTNNCEECCSEPFFSSIMKRSPPMKEDPAVYAFKIY